MPSYQTVNGGQKHLTTKQSHLTFSQSRVSHNKNVGITAHWNVGTTVRMFLAATKQPQQQAGLNQLMSIYGWTEGVNLQP